MKRIDNPSVSYRRLANGDWYAYSTVGGASLGLVDMHIVDESNCAHTVRASRPGLVKVGRATERRKSR